MNKKKEIKKEMKKIFVNREGLCDDSYMYTISLIKIFKPNIYLKFNNNKLCKASKNKKEKETIIKIPKYIYFSGDISLFNNNNNNNILGLNNILNIDKSILYIPVNETTSEKLGYYNCYLLENNDIFRLNAKYNVGLFRMSIGNKYLENYLLESDYGNGFYIEYHDQPHYYNFIDNNNIKKSNLNNNNKGYLVLGKKINGYYLLSAFEVPKNKGIYIPPYVYHCDGCLKGNYNVIYSITDNYKTFLIKNNSNKIVRILFD